MYALLRFHYPNVKIDEMSVEEVAYLWAEYEFVQKIKNDSKQLT